MKLNDFLKVERVKCVDNDTIALTKNKHYWVADIVKPNFKIGDSVYLPSLAGGEILKLKDNKDWLFPFFVSVTNSVKNSLYELDRNGKVKYGNLMDVAIKATQENYEILCKLHPHIEFEVVDKSKFKVGDKVYLFGKKDIYTIKLVMNDSQCLIDSLTWSQDVENLVLATQENYERLQATFPDIEFEKPSKELGGK